ncbi:hypothetical protein EWB00_003211 [Schistosoma japonicum]|uniref:Uncharacterized protein n=1 Tax=Schistosoma japonicum TaxID=6182 RepID=A0A4Z2D9A8_SCHJA|nr:hypothetical protein EWB00_003211 [Schistosoma japonicum]
MVGVKQRSGCAPSPVSFGRSVCLMCCVSSLSSIHQTKPNIITSHNTHLFTILYVVPHRHIYNLHAFISST